MMTSLWHGTLASASALALALQGVGLALALESVALLTSLDVVNGSEEGEDDNADVKLIGMVVGSVSGGLLCFVVLAVVVVSCLCRSGTGLYFYSIQGRRSIWDRGTRPPNIWTGGTLSRMSPSIFLE